MYSVLERTSVVEPKKTVKHGAVKSMYVRSSMCEKGNGIVVIGIL